VLLVLTYAGLFASAFTSATLLPGSSEAALIALLAAGQGEPVLLVAVATIGNVLGSFANWTVGRYLAHLRDRPWFPVGPEAYNRATDWVGRYGVWSLLLSWVPVIGDPLTLAAGLLRVPPLPFLLLVAISKAGRYVALLAAYIWWTG
jgi:membrane protein YqaA with SNARE-associated domain